MRTTALSLTLCLLGLVSACSGSKPKPESTDKGPAYARAEPVSDADWQALRTPRPKGDPLAFRFVDFRSGMHLGLINESHTDPAEFYSQRKKLADSLTKVGHDEVVAALAERFEEHGFFKRAQAGPAPATGAGVWNTSLEVERKGKTMHMLVGPNSDAKEREVFALCRNDFGQIYNSILGLQSVERAPDWNSQKPSLVPPKH